MVTASEIRDRDSLERWLSRRSRGDTVALAQRAACRVLPLWGASIGEDWAQNSGLTALPIVRANLTSGVGRIYAIPVATSNAAAAAEAVTGNQAPTAAYAAAYAAVDTAHAATAANAAHAVPGATVATTSATYAATRALASDATAMWDQIRLDAERLENGSLDDAPLWHGKYPNWFSEADALMRAIWSYEPKARWAFWIRWWDGVLSGRQVDWELQREVAEIPNDVWERGPDAVAEAIAKLEKRDAPDSEPRGSDDNLAQSHKAAMVRNARAVRLQLDTLRVFVEDEIERLRGANSLSGREHEALALRLEMLAKIIEAVALMRAAFDEDASGTNALVVVEAQLPAVVEAADDAVAGGEAPEVSAAIVSMATTIKFLTDAGMPGNYATGIAFADMCWGKIKSWWKGK